MLQFELTPLGQSIQTSHYGGESLVGFLPMILQANDPRPAKEQIAERYAHGGGWQPFKGFKMNPETHALSYPGDPDYKVLAFAKLNDEELYFYQHEWLAIVQPDGSFEVNRMD